MGVKPMSPSANFTTYRLPPSAAQGDITTPGAFPHHHSSYSLPRKAAATASSGLFRFLLCSRPCLQHSVDIQHDLATADLEDPENAHSENVGSSDVDAQIRTELQAVMRHLEVRWQLFDEALSRFGDLEAMLAICADKVRWRHHTSSGVRDAHAAEDLKSLILRKLSMEVSISRITQVASNGDLGTTFDREGHAGRLQARDRARLQAALDFFCEDGREEIRRLRASVLEEDTYILCNQKGEVVEEGEQVVIWEQYNSTWYIRGCISYPATSKLHQ